MKTITFLFLMLFSMASFADSPYLMDGRTGKYLGNLSSNTMDPNSVNNEYGRYGSKYSQDSINNPYSRYGSRYSNDSANNPYAINPPRIMHGGDIGSDRAHDHDRGYDY